MRNINEKAPVLCRKSIRIQAGAEKVWEVLTGINRWAEWQTDIAQPRLNGVLKAGATFDWKTGGVRIHSTLHTVEPRKQFGWTGKTWGLFAIHNWTLTDTEGETRVDVEESMEGFLARWFSRSFQRNLETGMENWLRMLKEKCEGKGS